MSITKEQQLVDIARGFLDDCRGLYEHTEDFLDAVNGYVKDVSELDLNSKEANELYETLRDIRSPSFLVSGSLLKARVHVRNIFNSKE